jgi:hypothetical protein
MRAAELEEAAASASPTVASFAEALYRVMASNVIRERLLRPLIKPMAATRHDELEPQRSWLLVDGSLRVIAAEALELAGLPEQAKRLRTLVPIRDADTARFAERTARSALADAERAAEEKGGSTPWYASYSVGAAVGLVSGIAEFGATGADAAQSVAKEAASVVLMASVAARGMMESTTRSAAKRAERAIWASAAELLEGLCQLDQG